MKEMDQLPDEIWINIMQFSQMPRLARVCKKLYTLEYGIIMKNYRIASMNRRYTAWQIKDEIELFAQCIVAKGSMDDLRFSFHHGKIRSRKDRVQICNAIANRASILGYTSMVQWMFLVGINNYDSIIKNAFIYDHGDIFLVVIRWRKCFDNVYHRLPLILADAQHKREQRIEMARFKQHPFRPYSTT
jgi:hypothetical protein